MKIDETLINNLKQDIIDVHFSFFIMYNSLYKKCRRYENDYGRGNEKCTT